MATLRKRVVKGGKRRYTYWVVDYSLTRAGITERHQRNFKDKAAADRF